MADRDYYEILGVSRHATAEEISRAYRRMAKKHHPDRNRGDKSAEQRFKDIQEAYEVLKDPRKRSMYDQFGQQVNQGGWTTSGANGYARATGPGGQEVNIDDLEDIFSVFTGGRGRGGSGGVFDQFFTQQVGGRRTPPHTVNRPGQDIDHEVRLSFDQAIHGTELELSLKPSSSSSARPEQLRIRVPAGVADGQRIRVRGKGGSGVGAGGPGDLYVTCRVGDHAYFRRDGADVYIDVPIGLTEAALGAAIEVPTVQGPATIRVPPGTPSGSKLRLRGRGIARGKGDGCGDHYAVIKIVPPRHLTDRQRELLETLSAESPENPRASVPWAREATTTKA